MTGTIFDIKRFSVHDGAGIRTSIFLKGCPLGCVWCHNPEGIDQTVRLRYFDKQCIQCRSCLQACPVNALSSSNNGKEFRIIVDHSTCTNCGECVEVCPANALSFDGQEVETGEVIREIMRDEEFFSTSGGGVTLTGGDPLAQPEFSIDILKKCGELGIHRTIETALLTSPDIIRTIIPMVDFFIVDLKIYDDAEHRKYTGVGNTSIFENFKLLMELIQDPESVLVRIPLIPDITAVDSNIRSIAQFVASVNKRIKIELLNYNPLAGSKYKMVEKEFLIPDNTKPYTPEEIEDLKVILRKTGVVPLGE